MDGVQLEDAPTGAFFGLNLRGLTRNSPAKRTEHPTFSMSPTFLKLNHGKDISVAPLPPTTSM